jgi:hypothetical protein
MDRYEAARLMALHAVVSHKKRQNDLVDLEYPMRKIFRWYSRTFFTPLHVVDTLPLDDVLQAYWEVQYEEMADEPTGEEDLAAEVARLTEDDDSLRQRQRQEDAEEVEMWEFQQEELAAAKEQKSIEGLKHTPKDTPILSYGPNDRESELVSSSPSPSHQPEIKMSFVDDLDLDADSFGFGLLDSLKKERK